MQIAVILDPAHLRRWHAWLFDELAARGLRNVHARLVPSPPPPLPAALELLLRLERLTGRVHGLSALDPIPASDPAFAQLSQFETSPALVIDLRGLAAAAEDSALRPLYDGSADECALWLALLSGRAPLVCIGLGDANLAIPAALPALEDPMNLTSAATMTFARVAEAIAIAAADLACGRAPVARANAAPHATPRSGSAAGFAASLIAGKARRILERRLATAPQWCVAYRSAATGRTHPPQALDAHAFTRLADDGQRYYADPFLFAHEGRLHLFVEEVPCATGRGIISHCILGSDGRFTPPRPVLERPYHLSYPQVFARDGHIWMMPEASASGAIELYRADPFPDRFVLHARLLEGAYHDATFFAHDDRLWIAAGSQRIGGSTWDGLSLLHAPRLDGPWTPHARNPVLVDASSARPAGDLYHAAGHLWRPSQDCTGGYGSALTLNRIDVLTSEAFSETPVSTLRIGYGPRVLGPHTLNWAGGIEVIDAFAPPQWAPSH